MQGCVFRKFFLSLYRKGNRFITYKHPSMKEHRIRPYSKSELAQAYAPDICPRAALNRLLLWNFIVTVFIHPIASSPTL